MNLLIVGSIAIDSIETPLGKAVDALGGSATYAAVAAARLARPGIVGVVGGDFDRRHLNLLRRQGIDLEGLQVVPDGKTFRWSGYYDGDMNQAHTRSTHLNVFASFSPVIPVAYRSVGYVLLGNIHPALQLEVLEQIRTPRMVLCDTMNFWITSEPALLTQVFKKVDVICINDAEARQFCGTDSLPVAARELLKLGPRRVIIKKGAHGVQLFGKDSFFSLPAVPLARVKDPTGAGDSFAGGFVGWCARSRRLNENSFRRALVVGTVMASYCVEDFSCRRTARLKAADISKRSALLREYTRMPTLSIG
jgi:sugar/nucleoside kinase (ribokinase family)